MLIVFNQHYIGTMDYWDPTVTMASLATVGDLVQQRGRLQQLRRVSRRRSSELTPSLHQGAGLKALTVLGFSIGGMVAQEITLQAPLDLVRRLIVDGKVRAGGHGMERR